MNTTEQSEMLLGMPAILASSPMFQLLAQVKRAAQTNATVLIQGESGSGKELIARSVHCFSHRANRNWVDVSCAALPEHLIESELFGYERGAFSGANSSKPGMFELAHQGTLFLDEIGELEPRLQVKLLRVLDGVPYYRLGGTRKIAVDTRIVAATNQDLKAMVQTGRFRGDLFYRLSQISLRVPPLRERQPDVLALARFFLDQIRTGVELTDGAITRLQTYRWPGNVRELRNVITKAAVASDGDTINAGDIEIEEEAAATGDSQLEQVERRAVLQMLKRTDGHQQQAAEALGISRRTLTRRLKHYREENRISA